ncbi:hypothetical protein O5O45_11685 [Hahella aquimaris]|uniref:hypothetical protein n=1 Tax=Hahella sp. HNIBRBA332 TaxID=3015983 RepID=UPI00273BBA21|nr:hypothetical protein [Hahella sp. HNIBRBA332]WLQ16582.1 hypothetical protein O5O45_11685 [Hahella sp. HNIBRBA332]
MNRTLFVAALLAAFTAAIHIFIGTPEIQDPLLQSGLPKEISLLLYACWHLVSITLALSAVAFFIASRAMTSNASLLLLPKFISYLWLGFGLIFIAVALLFSGSDMLMSLPQWTLLLPVGALGLWGCSKPSARRIEA